MFQLFQRPTCPLLRDSSGTKYKTLAELIANNDEKHCFYFIPLLEQEKINIDELQQFLMQCFRNGYIKNSYFKQLVCYYDYLKFGLEQ